MKEEYQIVSLEQNGQVKDVIRDNLESFLDAKFWIDKNKEMLGGRMEDTILTIRMVYRIK